jgi:hypothetical protein
MRFQDFLNWFVPQFKLYRRVNFNGRSHQRERDMNIPYQDMQNGAVDLGAVVTEQFLNDFSAGHFKDVPDIYSGHQRFTNFGNDIDIAYQFKKPILFHLTPIPIQHFKRIWHSYLKKKGAASLTAEQVVLVPPNLGLEADDVTFTITCYDGHSSTVVLTITFDWKITGLCSISLSSGTLTLVPIKLEFSDANSLLLEVLRRELDAVIRERNGGGPCGQAGSTDPVWCAKAEEFILFLLNSVLSVQMSNFVTTWKLPNAIQLFDGVNLSPNFLLIQNGMLVVGGQITTQPLGISPIQTAVERIIDDFRNHALAEFENADEEYIRRWVPENSSTLAWLGKTIEGLESQLKATSQDRVPARRQQRQSAALSPTLALCSNSKLFDVLAKKYLSANNGWTGGTQLDHIVKADIGWWFKVDNATGAVIPGGIQVSANVSIGGSVSVCVFDLDPKHFGDWACINIAAELAPLPNPPGFALQAYPNFKSDGIYVSANLLTEAIGLQVPGWPGWANDILGWVTGMMTVPLLAAIRLVISLLNIRIAQYPTDFPGTGMPWTPNMSSTPSNAGPYLVFSAAPQF